MNTRQVLRNLILAFSEYGDHLKLDKQFHIDFATILRDYNLFQDKSMLSIDKIFGSCPGATMLVEEGIDSKLLYERYNGIYGILVCNANEELKETIRIVYERSFEEEGLESSNHWHSNMTTNSIVKGDIDAVVEHDLKVYSEIAARFRHYLVDYCYVGPRIKQILAKVRQRLTEPGMTPQELSVLKQLEIGPNGYIGDRWIKMEQSDYGKP